MDPNEAKGRIKDYKNIGKDPEVYLIKLFLPNKNKLLKF